MTPEQIAYVARRRRQVRYWPWLALVLLLALGAGYFWAWQNAQININPFLVLQQFHHKTISEDELIMLAARGSLAMTTCGLFLLLVLLLVSVALLNESRLLKILDDVTAGQGGSGAPGEAPDGAAADSAVQVPATTGSGEGGTAPVAAPADASAGAASSAGDDAVSRG